MLSAILNLAVHTGSVYKGGADVCFVVYLICFVEALTWMKQDEGGGDIYIFSAVSTAVHFV